ncbi:MAG: serine/threonine-protein kinase [Myxococcota bacterium]
MAQARDEWEGHEPADDRTSTSGARRMPWLAPGTIVAGKYVLGRTLGIGGWAVVYDAEHLELGHRVAIKVPRIGEGAPATARERFLREVRLSAMARHRHIPEVHDTGRLPDGSPFLVMERLDGQDLDHHLARGPLSIPAAVELGRQLAAALEALADLGIVHRDIKPHNLVLHREAGDGVVVKLVDFGISKGGGAPATDGALTDDGMVIGTPHYMAPEQVEGQPVDCRTDVYAACIVLFESLTGRTPFVGETSSALLGSILRDPIPSLRALRPSCPAPIERILERGLAKRPAARHPHPRALRIALERAARSLALPAGATAWTAPDPEPPKPSRPLALLRTAFRPAGRIAKACTERGAVQLGLAGAALGAVAGLAAWWLGVGP